MLRPTCAIRGRRVFGAVLRDCGRNLPIIAALHKTYRRASPTIQSTVDFTHHMHWATVAFEPGHQTPLASIRDFRNSHPSFGAGRNRPESSDPLWIPVVASLMRKTGTHFFARCSMRPLPALRAGRNAAAGCNEQRAAAFAALHRSVAGRTTPTAWHRSAGHPLARGAASRAADFRSVIQSPAAVPRAGQGPCPIKAASLVSEGFTPRSLANGALISNRLSAWPMSSGDPAWQSRFTRR